MAGFFVWALWEILANESVIAGEPGFSAEIGGVMMASSQASLLPRDLRLLAVVCVNES
ncbi:hypothetical protein [Pseudomonas sp. MH10]|uniref:hypothetical protein n=1 Tax=Pseudomonas sp. MH10 TaxID=3048627 RepID=UPI002AC95A74|nr:hypothetical protein [Pseudomonas sp. MH10]WPX63379.1 hypothetical protein RHM59_21185 [Pseudomonas sp. MH10]